MKEELPEDIKMLNKKIKNLQKRIEYLESGSLKSLCNVTKENKRAFKIALRREYSNFESTSQFVKYCIKQYTGIGFKDFCDKGGD